MSVKKHYDEHLARFYSWMAGDFNERSAAFKDFLGRRGIKPSLSKVAVDLGAGHGLQTAAVASAGYRVIAVDFNDSLLQELAENTPGMNVEIVNDDIRNTQRWKAAKPELILCCGDTVAHLDDKADVSAFISGACDALIAGGFFILSFRDYTKPLEGNSRFIPVKSDENRILTCILDYGRDHVEVTDLLYEKSPQGWTQKVGSYKKVRISPREIEDMLIACDMSVTFNETATGMTTIVASKN